MRSSTRVLILATIAGAAVGASCSGDDESSETARVRPRTPTPAEYTPRDTLTLPARVDYIAIGGGADPASSQVSLEQDLALFRDVVGHERGVVLYAGGPGAASLHELGANVETTADSLLLRLGDLLAPRESRRARFRASAISPDGPSSNRALDEALTLALQVDDGTPLLLYINGHGDLGEVDAENPVLLWGGDAIDAHSLAALLDGHPRPTRIVVTSCYSGGFAELAFRAATPSRGPAPGDRCGLFATMPDREASGCDPNPDRAAQEGFSIHFLNALRRRDAAGQDLSPELVDFDGDGVVSLAEAHARARIAGRSIDVPTTTSERWLRERAAAPRSRRAAPSAPAPAPSGQRSSAIEEAVITALAADLGLPDEQSAGARLEDLELDIGTIAERMDEIQREADLAWDELRIGLLERWPTLDDPFDPRFAPTLAHHGDAITGFLDRSAAAEDYEMFEARLATESERLATVELQAARVTRLARAYENVRLEAALRGSGGDDLEAFERLRRCEATAIGAP